MVILDPAAMNRRFYAGLRRFFGTHCYKVVRFIAIYQSRPAFVMAIYQKDSWLYIRRALLYIRMAPAGSSLPVGLTAHCYISVKTYCYTSKPHCYISDVHCYISAFAGSG